MNSNLEDILSVHIRIHGVVLGHQHLDGDWVLDIIVVTIEGAVGSSEDVAAC